MQQWKEMKMLIDDVQLRDEADRVKWKIGSSGKFRVKDLYLQLRVEGNFRQKFLWKIKIPLKVRIFLWEILKNSILIKDNLLKRGWTGNEQYQFVVKREHQTYDIYLWSCQTSLESNHLCIFS
jgi:hypothetical protein